MRKYDSRPSRLWLRLGTAILVGGVLTALPAPSAHAAPPSNDEAINAAVVPGVPFTDSRDTTEATFHQDDSRCGFASVWYSFTPETDGRYQFDTYGSDYDTYLALWSGTVENRIVSECNDNAPGSLQSSIVADLTAGTTYLVEAGHAACASPEPCGTTNLVFSVDLVPAVFDLQFTVDNRATIASGPGATLSGSYTCNMDGEIFIFATLQQRQGKFVATGEGGGGPFCIRRTPGTWTLFINQTSARAFVPGTAILNLFADGCDHQFTSCDSFSVTRTIKLRR